MDFFFRSSVSLTFVGLALGLVSSALSQTVIDNIRPVARVCTNVEACTHTGPSDNDNRGLAENIDEEPTTATGISENSRDIVSQDNFDAAAAYQQSCFACHASGAAGAPLLGDADAWAVRTEKGMEAVMSNVINGFNAMPAKGMCMDCSDADLKAIVDFMIAQ